MNGLQLARVNSKLNNTYDDFPGGGNRTPGQNAGQLGLVHELIKEHASKLNDLDVGPLYEGEYQYVKLGASPIIEDVALIPDRGMLLFWEDRANHVVTVDDTLRSELAGVFLNAVRLDADALPIDPAGLYVFMQKVGPKSFGRATVKVTTGSAFAADEVVVAAGDGTALAGKEAVESPFAAYTVGLAEDVEDADDLVIVRLGA